MDWNGLQVFLAVVQSGSVRAAGERMQMSHSTVSRRVEALEAQLGVTLFDRLAVGYALTAAGEALVPVAERVEAELFAAQRKLSGSDKLLAGRIQFTLPDVAASHLLMPELASFTARYPNITLDMLTTYQPVDLNRRETDIALRFVFSEPPEHLIGHKLAGVAYCAYATQAYLDTHDLSDPDSACWIGHGTADPFPSWVKSSAYPHLPARGLLPSQELQYHAALNGMGIGDLVCFLGDASPDLVRLPGSEPVVRQNLWLLRHQDTLATARLQVFSDYLREVLAAKASLLEGGK